MYVGYVSMYVRMIMYVMIRTSVLFIYVYYVFYVCMYVVYVYIACSLCK